MSESMAWSGTRRRAALAVIGISNGGTWNEDTGRVEWPQS